MTPTPPALTALIRQVVERDEDAAIELADIDGYGRARTARFGDVTSEWLAPVVETLGDKRIASSDVDEGILSVTVVADRRGDDGSPYSLGHQIKPSAAPEEQEPDTAYEEERKAELEGMKAGELREEYPDYADLPNKAAIIEALLKDEFPD